jgi:hypothetical protein
MCGTTEFILNYVRGVNLILAYSHSFYILLQNILLIQQFSLSGTDVSSKFLFAPLMFSLTQ